jgi:AraC-like DNA-binding protein
MEAIVDKPAARSGQRKAALPEPVVIAALRDSLVRGLLPVEAGCRSQTRESPASPSSRWKPAAFVLCSQGMGWCELRGRRHAVHAGDLLVLPPGEPWAYGADLPHSWSLFWLLAVGDEVRQLLPLLGARPEAPILRLGVDPQIAAGFTDLIDALERGRTRPGLFQASRVAGYLISLMMRRAGEHEHCALNARQRIASCIAYMRRHFDKPISLTMLAELAGLTPTYFSKLFRDQTRHSSMDFLRQLRAEQARHLLDSTPWPVKTIAARVGYDDPLHFSRAFRGIYGVSPRQYRRGLVPCPASPALLAATGDLTNSPGYLE